MNTFDDNLSKWNSQVAWYNWQMLNAARNRSEQLGTALDVGVFDLLRGSQT